MALDHPPPAPPQKAMRRLLAAHQRGHQRPEMRPAFLSIITLMFLLLPFLLLTTSVHKLTGIGLGLVRSGGDLPPLPPGNLEDLVVVLDGCELLLRSAVRTVDVTASQGDITWNERHLSCAEEMPDLSGMQAALHRMKALDPKRQRITLLPAPDTPAGRVVALMDAVRQDAQGPLFPQVVLGNSPLSDGMP